MAQGSRNYALQRNYEYDSHDENQQFNGLTIEDWKKQILVDWSPANLKANHVTIIFHNKDKDGNGILKSIHAHAIANEEETMTQSSMMKHAKCSCEENCTPIKEENLAKAYRYELHITEQAIKDKKHIYSEDELIFLVADGKTFGIKEYHNMIARKVTQTEDQKKDKELINETIKKILEGYYGTGLKSGLNAANFEDRFDKQLIIDEVVKESNVILAMGRNSQLYTKVMNSIKLRIELTKSLVKELRDCGMDISTIAPESLLNSTN
uniref:hypothetical protein n=1 Tax=Acetatifactor sp. TaxID=1872090 RepID=UPI004057BED2